MRKTWPCARKEAAGEALDGPERETDKSIENTNILMVGEEDSSLGRQKENTSILKVSLKKHDCDTKCLLHGPVQGRQGILKILAI